MREIQYEWLEKPVFLKEDLPRMNQIILVLLINGGIRLCKAEQCGDVKVEVVSLPEVESDGRIRFNYSVLEECKREISTYDTNTGELILKGCGYQHYAFIMSLLLTVEEAFSETACKNLIRDENRNLFNKCMDLLLIEEYTGEFVYFKHENRQIQEIMRRYRKEGGGRYHLREIIEQVNNEEYMNLDLTDSDLMDSGLTDSGFTDLDLMEEEYSKKFQRQMERWKNRIERELYGSDD